MTNHMTDEQLRQAALNAVDGREDDFPHALAILRVGDLLERLAESIEALHAIMEEVAPATRNAEGTILRRTIDVSAALRSDGVAPGPGPAVPATPATPPRGKP